MRRTVAHRRSPYRGRECAAPSRVSRQTQDARSGCTRPGLKQCATHVMTQRTSNGCSTGWPISVWQMPSHVMPLHLLARCRHWWRGCLHERVARRPGWALSPLFAVIFCDGGRRPLNSQEVVTSRLDIVRDQLRKPDITQQRFDKKLQIPGVLLQRPALQPVGLAAAQP
jgi:hypothetical protein